MKLPTGWDVSLSNVAYKTSGPDAGLRLSILPWSIESKRGYFALLEGPERQTLTEATADAERMAKGFEPAPSITRAELYGDLENQLQNMQAALLDVEFIIETRSNTPRVDSDGVTLTLSQRVAWLCSQANREDK